MQNLWFHLNFIYHPLYSYSGVMVIIEENGVGKPHSNPGKLCK